MSGLRLGSEIVEANPRIADGWGRCALLCNQASVNQRLEASWVTFKRILGSRLVSLFSPQHGLHATVQDNMIETGHSTEPASGLPIYSLYSETREPTAAMLEGCDTILIDLQIVGCRVYTFKYTIAACLRAAKKYGKNVVILDRPNPLGGELVEGRVLDMDATSFVGEFPIPMRHGLTPAEAGRYFNKNIQANLSWVAMEGWNAGKLWHEHGREWVITSPNLPTVTPVYVYPGTVMLEGTNLSEGRGTGLPFQFVGAPYIASSEAFAARLSALYRPDNDVFFRPAEFQPTSQKWQGETCRGIQLHVLDPHRLRSFALGVAILRAGLEAGGEKFQWKQPPYEYDYKTLPMKLILGTHKVPDVLTKNDFDCHGGFWREGLTSYCESVAGLLLYPRKMRTH